MLILPAPKDRHEGMDLKPVISAPLNDERDPQRVKNEFSATVAAMMNDAGMKNLLNLKYYLITYTYTFNWRYPENGADVV